MISIYLYFILQDYTLFMHFKFVLQDPIARKRRFELTGSSTDSSKKLRPAIIGVRSSSPLSVKAKRVRTESRCVSRFSPTDIEKSSNEQLKLTSLTCTRLRTKFNSYASFHISVVEDDFHLINNTGVWPSGCLIAPYYRRLDPDQIYSAMSALSCHSSPGSGVSTLDPIGGSANSDEPQEDGTTTLS
jgi:hypothetical protein